MVSTREVYSKVLRVVIWFKYLYEKKKGKMANGMLEILAGFSSVWVLIYRNLKSAFLQLTLNFEFEVTYKIVNFKCRYISGLIPKRHRLKFLTLTLHAPFCLFIRKKNTQTEWSSSDLGFGGGRYSNLYRVGVLGYEVQTLGLQNWTAYQLWVFGTD